MRAARRPKVGWGQHTRKYRDRVAREAYRRYGLSRRQVREMYGRGTFRPSARNPEDRIPRKFQGIQRTGGTPLNNDQLRDLVIGRYDRWHEGSLYWTEDARSRTRANLDDVDRAHLLKMLGYDEEQSRKMAAYNEKDIRNRTAPRIVLDSAWKDSNGRWHSIFWYH